MALTLDDVIVATRKQILSKERIALEDWIDKMNALLGHTCQLCGLSCDCKAAAATDCESCTRCVDDGSMENV